MARKIRGGQNSRTKLTDDQARAIFASDESIAILAQRYGVGKGTIRDIQTGKSWIHIHENQELPERADVIPANPPGLPENVRAIRLADGSHAIIDAADAESVAGRSWSFHAGSKGDNGAIYCSERAADGGERRVALHRLLLDAPPDHLVIHRDGDPFNNRRSNLALITPEYRSHRAKRSIRNTSGYKGVFYDRRAADAGRAPWEAVIAKRGRRYSLGRFETAAAAARCYNEVAPDLYGDLAFQNDISKAEDVTGGPVRYRHPLPADWQAVFLDALRRGDSIRAAAQAAGVSQSRVYGEREANAEFAAAWAALRARSRRGTYGPGEWQAVFLDALRAGKTVLQAANAACVGQIRAYNERKQNPEFARAWAEVIAEGRQWQPIFLDALRAGKSPQVAASEARIILPTAYQEQRRNPAFAQAWADIRQAARAAWRPILLAEISVGKSIRAAARATGVSPSLVFRERQRDPAFAQAVAAALATPPLAPSEPPPWAAAFLDALQSGMSLQAAARAAGVGPTSVYETRARNPIFAQALAEVRSTIQAGQPVQHPRPLWHPESVGDPQETTDQPAWQARVLDALRSGQTIGAAACAAGVSRARCDRERQHNPAFAQAWDTAIADATPAWHALFLDALRAGRKVWEAAKAAGVAGVIVFTERKRNPAFAQAWLDAVPRQLPAQRWYGAFLDAVREGKNIREAARTAGIDVKQVYKTRQRDPAFAQAWAEAQPAARVARPQWQVRFLDALGSGQSLRAAARAAGVGLTRLYNVRDHDDDFARAWVAASARPSTAARDGNDRQDSSNTGAALPAPVLPSPKLAPELVRAIRDRYRYGESPQAIAAALSMSLETVAQVVAELAPLPAPRPLEPDAATRFWEQVDRSGGSRACWSWQGRQDKGWGRFWSGGVYHQAQRAAYTLAFGEVPPRHVVIQECGNRLCINPDHLLLERVSPPPQTRGETHGQAKLSDAEVTEIRLRYSAGAITLRALGDVYGVTESAIRKLVRGQRRTDAPGPITTRPASTPGPQQADTPRTAGFAAPAVAARVIPIELPDATRPGERYHLTWGTGRTLCGQPCSAHGITDGLTFAPHRDCQLCTRRARKLSLRCPACGQMLEWITADGRCVVCVRANRKI